jgi:hypothetical protein
VEEWEYERDWDGVVGRLNDGHITSKSQISALNLAARIFELLFMNVFINWIGLTSFYTASAAALSLSS